MSLQHFFLKDQDLSKSIEQSSDGSVQLFLSSDDLHHAKVLRLNPGEHIGVIDCNSVYFECEIVDFTHELIVKNCQRDSSFDKHCSVTLAPGVSKGNKLDDVIRACTEIGVDRFVPTVFERSVVKLDEKKQKSRLERWNKIAKSASMQSGRISIPEIDDILNVNQLAQSLSDYDAVLLFWEEAESAKDVVSVCESLKNADDNVKIAIIIGPEGGISQNEVDVLCKCNKNTKVVSLGQTILRTQTADIAACSIVNFLMSC